MLQEIPSNTAEDGNDGREVFTVDHLSEMTLHG